MDSRSMSLDPFTMKFSSPSEFGMLLAAAGRVRPAFYDDLLVLKYLHQRYTNYLAWLRWQG